MKFKEFVTIHTCFNAKHRWKNAPKQVAFLKEVHPHEFKVVVSIQVKDNNRQIEYYMLKDEVDKIVEEFRGKTYERSCEQFAELIFNKLVKTYGDLRDYEITVAEDQGFSSTLRVEGNEEDE